MIDHILCFATAEARPQSDAPCWLDDKGRTWMQVDCVIADATFDAGGMQTAPAIVAPGAWAVCRAASVQDDISALPECLIIADSVRAAKGEPFVLMSRLLPDTPLGKISPVFAGDAYPFPSGPASGLLPLMVAD